MFEITSAKKDETDKEEWFASTKTKEEESIKGEQEIRIENIDTESKSVRKASSDENEDEKKEKLIKVSEGSVDLVEKVEDKKGDVVEVEVGGKKE